MTLRCRIVGLFVLMLGAIGCGKSPVVYMNSGSIAGVPLMIDVQSIERTGTSYTMRVWIKAGEITKPKVLRIAVLEIDPRSPRKEPGRTLYEMPSRLLPDFGTLRPGVRVTRTVTFRLKRPLPNQVCPLFSVEATGKEGLVSTESSSSMTVLTEDMSKRRPKSPQ